MSGDAPRPDRRGWHGSFLSPGACVVYAMFILAGVVFLGMKFGLGEVIRQGGTVPPAERAVPEGRDTGPWRVFETTNPADSSTTETGSAKRP